MSLVLLVEKNPRKLESITDAGVNASAHAIEGAINDERNSVQLSGAP